MKKWKLLAVCAAAAIALAGRSAGAHDDAQSGVTLKVLSSAPEYVSGGDARIEVKAAPGLQDQLTFWLNGNKITPPMVRGGVGMEGIVSGMLNGQNTLEVRHVRGDGRSVSESIILTNYPIAGPIFSGPQQQPFICRSQESGLGQPLVDNQDGTGHPVFDASSTRPVGFSKFCSIPTQIRYLYFTGSRFKPFDPVTGFTAPPSDLKTTTVNGVPLPFVVRVEGGTINRFLYTIAMLAPFPEPSAFDNSAWNKKLVYWMRGGVGIGHQQGTAMWFNDALSGAERQLMPVLLAQGFALASSSGNETGVHYNMRLAEETAMMTKEHFIKAYGKPRFTIGVGGSGGAVEQYLFAQNRPGLLDGGIPIQSFPDMVTQTIPISDCPLLGQYFMDDVALNPVSPWAKWSNQAWIEGMSASDTVRNALFGNPGSTECINGWSTAMPTVLNPSYKDTRYAVAASLYRYPADAFANVKWTHWNDLANIYGTDSQGYAPVTIDNVGVQYGLGALARAQIGTQEFLRINACVGGWKEAPVFVDWTASTDPYDAHNMQRGADCRASGSAPAPRRAGDLSAMRNAYMSGQVFTGQRLGIPMIDLRSYLEPVLNMHNARQSFSVRARLLQANGGAAKNQVIWFAGSDSLAPVVDALSVVDRYLSSGSAPAEFTDKCVDASDAVIASGASVWDGILNQKAPGACAMAYPVLTSPRMEAGASIKGDIFKCALKPVLTALADGTYPAAEQFTDQEKNWLNRIFPQGVCDFSQGDQGRPAHW